MSRNRSSSPSPQPLRAYFAAPGVQVLRMVGTDVDGTLTRRGKLDPDVVAGCARLRDAGISMVPVSGRPAGEVLGLCRYLPGVQYGIAENGQVEVVPDRPPRALVPAADRELVRREALAASARLGLDLRPTADDVFRVVDVAFERAGREPVRLRELAQDLARQGLHTIWSSVHIHVSAAPPDKGIALLQVAAERGVAPATIMTLGDAPNDAGLFGAGRFGVSVGTADILAQLDDLPDPPAFVTDGGEGDGFLEVVGWLLGQHSLGAAASATLGS